MQKFRKSLLTVACAACVGYAHADEPKSYVGLQYKRAVPENYPVETRKMLDEPSKELPKECKSEGYFEKLSPTHRYGMTSVTCNGQTLGWLEEFIGPVANNPKMIEVKIVDQISIRGRQGYESVSSDIGRSEGGCYLKGDKKRKSVTIMGLYEEDRGTKGGRYTDRQGHSLLEKTTAKAGGIHELWVVNPATKKIEHPPKEWAESLVCNMPNSE